MKNITSKQKKLETLKNLAVAVISNAPENSVEFMFIDLNDIRDSLSLNDGVSISKKRGRPSTNFDKKAYQRQYMADKRQAEKLGVSVREYRETFKNGR
jgi:hypothetical protein